MIDLSLLEGGRAIGIDFTETQRNEFQLYHDAIMHWKDRVGLVSRNDLDRIAQRHFLDSLTPIPLGLVSDSGRLVDIGAGAGFPGLPLAIYFRNISVCLVESNRKKSGFLRYAVKALGLDKRVSVHMDRVESFSENLAQEQMFDVAVSRAVGSLKLLVTLSAPLLKSGGSLIAYKGPDVEDELHAAKARIEAESFVIEGVHMAPVSLSSNRCTLVVLRKL